MQSESPNEAAIRDWCVDYLSRTLDLPGATIEGDTKFSRLGLDSASAVYFIVELEDRFGIELTPDAIVEHPTIAELARFLARRLGGAG